MKINELYNKIKPKYDLPEYNELNTNFMIDDIDPETTLILSKIRIKISEKIDFYVKIIESVLQPDSGLSNMYEAQNMDEKQRKQLYLLFKKLMRIIRKSNLVAVNNSEEQNADFIKESYNDWSALKQTVESHIKKMSEAWKKETDIKDNYSYFG